MCQMHSLGVENVRIWPKAQFVERRIEKNTFFENLSKIEKKKFPNLSESGCSLKIKFFFVLKSALDPQR